MLEVFGWLFPLPLRWVWFCLYGLFMFRCSIVLLMSQFNLDLLAILHESTDTYQNHLKKTDSLIGYLGCFYLGLLVVSWLIPSPILPVIIVCTTAVVLLIPVNRFALPYRFAFLGCLKRVLMNGWRTPTKFTELVLADVMTSYAKILADWDALLWCYLLIPIYLPTGEPGSSCAPSILSVFLVCFPYFIRFRQTVADFWTTRQQKHLVNAFKYFTSFPVIYLSFLLSGTASRSVNVFWILALAVNFGFSCYWDIFMDWDLVLCKPAKRQYLLTRHRMLYKDSPSFYPAAALFNTAIRCLWLMRIYFVVSGKSGALHFVDSPFGIFLLQSLEITRRFLWLAIRIEVQILETAAGPEALLVDKAIVMSSDYDIINTVS